MNQSAFSNRSLLLVLLVVVFALAGCGSAVLQVKANNALQEKRYDEALAAYQEILKTDPANVEALKGIGETYLRMKKAPMAVDALEKAYKMDPDRRTVINLGLAYYEAGDYGKAISSWDIILAREPESTVSTLLRKYRTLALYRDADKQAKHALAQERALIAGGIVAAGEEAPEAPVVSPTPAPTPAEKIQEEPPPKASKKTKRSRKTSRKARSAKAKMPEAKAEAAAPPPKPERRAAVPAKARVATVPRAKLEKAFPVDDNTLAVSPFGEKGNTRQTTYLRKALAAMIVTDLSKAPGIRVVERVRMQKLLDELKLGQSGIVDPKTSPRVGRLLGAGKIVSGSMLGTGADDLHVLRILTSVSTGKDLGDQDARGKVDEFFKMQKAIVLGILKDLGIKLTAREEELITRYATHNYKGLLLYGEGLDLQDRGDWDKAIQVFQQCVLLDPTGPCGPALAGAPSSSDAAVSAEGVSAAVSAAAAADTAAAAAAAAGGGGGGH
jgi:cytochrome c-type biogenesis protein CcmH/NrfG/TolB-like protein